MSHSRPRQKKGIYKNITPYVVSSPVGIDRPIKDLQLHLSDSVSWLEKSFNRAVMMSYKEDDNDVLIPKCWFTEGEQKDEIPMIAQDYWSSYTFFYGDDSESLLDYNEFDDNYYESEVSLYVWLNIKDIDPANVDGYSNKYKQDILNALKTVNLSDMSNLTITYIENNPLEVYNRFTFDNTDKQFYYPFIIFRVDMNIIYDYSDC